MSRTIKKIPVINYSETFYVSESIAKKILTKQGRTLKLLPKNKQQNERTSINTRKL